MPRISIIFSRHSELGKCNSNELYKIFENIGPDVIFEEMPPSSYANRYIFKNHRSLETVAIDRYTQKCKIPHIGVDLEEIPSVDFFSEHRKLYQKIERLDDADGHSLRSSMAQNTLNSQLQGFEYLNSLECQEFYNNVQNAIENGVKKMNDEKLNKVLQSWNEVIDRRENQMLRNIYSYCRENNFEQGIFTIGAAHSKSILNKISEFDRSERIKIHWNSYDKRAII
jgi:hypothetical protein